MTTREFQTILWEQDGGIGTITINRPEQFNGMTNTMLRETHELLHDVADDDSVTVVVLTGAGKAFCPGADLKHYTSGAPNEPNKDEYFDVPVMLHEMPQLTVAAINGACAGAGLGWACGCDFRYAARSAKLNTAFLDVAVAGDMGLPWSLPRIVGAAAARDLSFFPRKVTADEAAAIGLVNAAFDDDVFRDEVRARVERLAGAAPLARRSMKAHYVAAESMGFGEFVAIETKAHGTITASADTKEAFSAFVEKRTPRFQGK
jgi:2-(1,2-epoxy-1,2-dihydrophenyl)acetyl-CoA isomerase